MCVCAQIQTFVYLNVGMGKSNIVFLHVDEQMVNHIPNCNLLTNKLGLLNTLQEYDRVYGSIKKRVPKLDFIPETYKLDDSKERDLFKDKWKGK